MIEINNLCYKTIIRNINITIPTGFSFLEGSNGEGKTTFLDCLSGINNQYTGSIKGNNNMLYLNQNLYFSYKIKSKDFVNFIFEVEGMKNKKQSLFMHGEEFGILEEMERNWDKEIGKLSGGERKRLFFSTVFCLDRDWYILDEPFAGVDKSGKDYMIKVMNNFLHMKRNLIITSHETEPLTQIDHVHKFSMSDGTIASMN
ncbi:ATP-binding cassette domain-containing protein [Paenibacillus illinoisensis]|uniref:Methionine ABC transporter ATP-binding protein n=1 Tax=Paenibacillus illinoisensis TaxID=59845 RepID=A0A2W0CAN0_9BACL|nr:ATP-binding cassette domain-containing protein [Paenibacillus illinoisensis]PYY29740.1 Methionine ABC transporter ATP-binding protein [Paenibacillus illinoisensis]